MKRRDLKSGARSHLGVAVCVILLASALAGCTAMDPQGAAKQQAPNYYGQPYSSLSPGEKMQLENHLGNQSNEAWRTTAQLASGAGHLAQGAGILLFAVRH